MAYCGPACAVPNIASTPQIGFGSGGCHSYASLGAAFRGLRSGCLGPGGPLDLGAGALVETSASLGTLAGVRPSCINQTPPSEITISPPPVIVTLPGPIMSASCEPVAVGGDTPCAVGNQFGGYGALGYANSGRRGRGSSASSRPIALGVDIPWVIGNGLGILSF